MAGKVTYTIETIEHVGTIAAGEEVTVAITVGEIDALCMVELIVGYNAEKLEAIGGTIEGFLADEELFVSALNANEVGQVYIGGVSLEDVAVTEETVIATITFVALEDIDANEVFYAVKAEAAKAPIEQLEVEVVEGGIVIIPEETEDTTTTTTTTTTTEAPADTTTTEAATTTTTAVKDDVQTGDVGRSMIYIVIAGLAVVAIVLSTVMMKKKAR